MRRALVRLHLWLGLTIGLLWALQGLTGAALVFHRELDRWSVAGVAAGPMAPVPALLGAAERAGGGRVTMLSVADAQGGILLANVGEQVVRIEAATARVIDVRDAHGGWRWLYELHEELLLHDRGKTLIGGSGILLLSSALMGLWIGWPKGRGWRSALRPSTWRNPRARLYGWHRLAGLFVTPALVLLPLTGATMAFGSGLRPWLGRVAGFQLPPKLSGPVPAEPIAPDAAVAAARDAFPNASFVRLTMPRNGFPAYAIRLLQPGEVRSWSGTTSVTIDAATGAELARYDALTAPVANRLYDAAFPVHSGEIEGLPARLAVFLAGLSLPALYVTGVVAWWRRRRTTPRPARVSPELQPAE